MVLLETENYRLSHLYANRATALHARGKSHLRNGSNCGFIETAGACTADNLRVDNPALLIHDKLDDNAAFDTCTACHIRVAERVVERSLTANHLGHVFNHNENFIFEVVCWWWRWWRSVETSIKIKEGVHVEELIINDGIIRNLNRYRRTRRWWRRFNDFGLDDIFNLEFNPVDLLDDELATKIHVELK